MISAGVDWAGAGHDVCALDAWVGVLARRTISDPPVGAGKLHALLAYHPDDDDDLSVIVGIEKNRRLIVTALVAAKHPAFAVNALGTSRWRARTADQS